jgi:hypothetical protein
MWLVWGEPLVTLKSILHRYNLFEKKKKEKKKVKRDQSSVKNSGL